MKAALLINRKNFEKYSKWDEPGWELIHMGNGEPDAEKIIATGATALVVDAIAKIGPEIILKMPGLKLIHSQGVAYNWIDIDAARSVGAYVCNCAGVNARPVAEHAVMLILTLLKGFRSGEDMVYSGRQMEAKTACFENGLPELYGRKVGIVGFGAIGKMLASVLKPFGCELFYYTRSGDCGEAGLTYMALEELYANSDIVSVNVPVTPVTTNMINGETLKLFKRGAILINTARGELVDHEAVADALKSGQLGGFGTDTLAPEPVLADNPFLSSLPEELRARVSLSPHIAGITAGTFIRVYELVKQNIKAIERGERPSNVVSE
jgi:lactate dehydrogenase-like 2-hydroxyacid dehydrogenase